MHQSRKEQGVERITRMLLNPDRREARAIAELAADMEAGEEWEGRPQHAGRSGIER
ncbi:hypothetical protein [Paenibacillus nanensis]|uniref:hypothetical protein n=1 Tax=Paenibacillus nanensis TaxID=393251 RepID=UPI0013C2C7FB|nr:hypothetical protein [Paenibacillus nanensis]